MTFNPNPTPAGWDPKIAQPTTDVPSLVQAAVQTAVGSMLSDAAPKPETNASGVAGTDTKVPKADHQHPPVRSATVVTLNASGTAVVTYTRSFDSPPCFVPVAINPSGRPVQVEVVSDIQDANGKYIGANIRGYRSQLLPSLSGIVLLGNLITAIGNFDVLGGSAAGVQIRFVALPQTV